MDHQWVKNRNRISSEYIDGIKEFMHVARQSLNLDGLTLCPCNNCLNTRLQSMEDIKLHLIDVGIDTSYTRWVYHGEEKTDEDFDGVFANDDVGLEAGLHDAVGNQFFDIGPTDDLIENQQPNHENNARYEKLFEVVHNPLYEGCGESALTFVVKLMNIKVLNKWSDKSFEMLLKLLHEVLPQDNNCPDSYYNTRKLLCEVGLGYDTIDVCQYDCAIFYGEYENATVCPVCKSGRYIRHKIPHKRLRYFPITPRLKRLYASRHTARNMRWHKEVRKEEPGVLRHPADGKAWKNFDELYPDFASDSRNVRMGLASDGFNPFSNMSTSHSIWPVILMPYNMPPWCTMHKSNYLLTLLIPGPKSPGKDFDIFLRPLVDELKALWQTGVQTYDEYSKSQFTLRAAVIWTISDFPAYAYLSGWSTMGKLACPICLEDTRYRRIRGKQCYAGHRSFLDETHTWRRSTEYDGKAERRRPPRKFSGEDILLQLDGLPALTPGKAPNNEDRKRKRGVDELNWTKKSIMFELPYWSKLLMRHNLDVMHIEKNVCDNIIGTLLNDPYKSKDTPNARLDLQDLNIRKELWLRKRNEKFVKPHANYTLSKVECVKFCDFIKSIRLPDGYASNISRCVMSSNTLGGMKTHDCHVLLQKILPAAILPFLEKKIRVALIEVSQFFQKLCAKTLYVSELEDMKNGIVILLCKLEKIFPPAFFTIMVHLCVHLPEQALLGGPVNMRWMFGIERRMGTYKGYVRNFARPDGSISEAYIVDEAITFLSRYLLNTETRFTRLERNWDISIAKYSMEIFNNQIRTLGAPTFELLKDYRNTAHWYILNNCGDTVDIFINEHKEILRSKNIREEDVDGIQKNEFPTWFKEKMSVLRVNNDPRATDDLYSLSQWPDDRYRSWFSCIVNGVRFRCKIRDDKFKTQCSGVSTWGDGGVDDIIYYGVLIEILELDYINQRKVFLFRCKWYNSDPMGKRIVVDHNLTSIDVTSEWYKDEPFILATQAQQVFYLQDLSRGKNWMVVQKVNHRNIFDIVEREEGEEEPITNEVFQEDDSSELPHFHPTEDVVETSSLVREDIDPITIPDGLMTSLHVGDYDQIGEDTDENSGDERFIVNDESILESDVNENSNDSDFQSDDDLDST
ncbi:uncharacterized protein LOC130992829 [Salvia miltiorrhiza]|uniref:uncharacterized protein LOC130991388 n=1 Tax=Salvia miltiorrhiza TaxID=226208 RepID=UPI0025AC7296|nr:uncharacterized protein LOC130991388 [Salvia miltiorrhiza]XP_057773560.1 uncharacterized protein LOC130992829 [Salvia miltiorrhiza]